MIIGIGKIGKIRHVGVFNIGMTYKSPTSVTEWFTEGHFQRACRNNETKSGAANAGNSLQINEATNKNAVNCSVMQPTANACDVKDSQGGTRRVNHNIFNNIGLRYSENLRGTKCVTLSDNGTLSPDDQQALQTIISTWPTLAPETKVSILQAIESERLGRC